MAPKGHSIVILFLLIIALHGPAAFANYLADITVSRESPASVPNHTIIEVACDWQWDGAGHDIDGSVVAIPMTNGSISPGAWIENFNIPGAGSGRCWPSFTIETGSVMVDEILLVMENSHPEYEKLLELSIPVEIHFGPHAFHGIDVDYATPNRMQFGQFINVSFIWETDYAAGKRIVARPLTGDSFTPGMTYIGSPILPGTSGMNTRGFAINNGEVDVTAILFEMFNEDWSQLIYSFRLPVNYHYASTAIQNIEFNPAFPASRIHNNNINVSFDYRTDYPLDPVVSIIPYTDGAPTPGGEVTPTMPLAPGFGSGNTVFDVLEVGGMVDVDAVLIEMRDFFDPGVLIDSFFVPVYYHFSRHAVRAVNYDPPPPAILSNGTYVDVTITWENAGPDDGYLHMTPRSWGSDTPDVDGYLRSISYMDFNPAKLHFFTVTAGNHLVDRLHLDTTNGGENELWMTYLYPAWFMFAGPGELVPVMETTLPTAPVLVGNFPNPFNPRTEIAFELPEPAAVTLKVYDLAGRLTKVLMDGEIRPEGRGSAVWDGTDRAGHSAAAGVYVYRLETKGFTATGRMALVD